MASESHRGAEILKANTLTLILALLGEQPMYGYQIAKEVQRRSGGALRFRQGLLYPALHQLERDNLIEGDWQTSPHGPRRRYYRLTTKGRREAAALRGRWESFSQAVNQVLTGGGGD
jgi:PadR family transcriptional regulator PadR